MTEQERRNVEDFFAHRAEVLKRITQALVKGNEMPKPTETLSNPVFKPK